MISVESLKKMEHVLKESISLGFFEHRTHSDMDLEIFKAYDAVRMLRIIQEEYETELREVVEELQNVVRNERPDES